MSAGLRAIEVNRLENEKLSHKRPGTKEAVRPIVHSTIDIPPPVDEFYSQIGYMRQQSIQFIFRHRLFRSDIII